MPSKHRPPAPDLDAFYEHLREAQRIEQQRLARERDYELYQAQRRRSEPDHELRIKRIMDKYAFKLRCLRVSYMGIRSIKPKSQDIDCG